MPGKRAPTNKRGGNRGGGGADRGRGGGRGGKGAEQPVPPASPSTPPRGDSTIDSTGDDDSLFIEGWSSFPYQFKEIVFKFVHLFSSPGILLIF